MICPYCKEEIKDGSIKCRFCKSLLVSLPEHIVNSGRNEHRDRPIATSIISLIFGILSLLHVIDVDKWDKDTVILLLFLFSISIATGIASLQNKHNGKGMAIAGCVTAGLALLISL